MKTQRAWVFIIIFAVLVTPGVFCQEKTEQGSVRIPWEEFRKLLELDKDEIVLSWQEFQKILVQTGFSYVPPFQLKDEKVILTRPQFKQLLDRMRPPVTTGIQPPADYLLTKAVYRGRIAEASAVFRVEFLVEIFPRQRNQYVKIPIFPVNLALREAFFDGQPALLVLENNRHTLATDQIGRHEIAVEFSLKSSTDQGPWSINFPIPRTAITSLDVDIPFTEIDVEVQNAQQMEISPRGNQTHVFALLAPSNVVDLKWRKKPKEVEKGPAKIYADTINHLVIEDDALRVNTEIALSVLQNTIASVVVQIPAGYSILDVRGSGLGDWREITREGTAYLEVPFEYPKQGNFSFSVLAEKLLPNATMAVDFSGFAVENAIREKGFLGVELKSPSEVTLSSSEGLDRLDVSELPGTLIGRSLKPLLFGFKYLRHPFLLVLDIQKHEELPVIGTVVDSASGVTLFTEDGKRVHRIVYKVRNTSKQFLELALPQGAQVWSVFIAGEPAKPRLNEERILIPLNRSTQGATGLAAFDVELIFFEKSDGFTGFGRKQSLFPVPDIIMSQVLWSVYLPEGYRFLYFGGSMEKEKLAQGLRPLLGSRRKVTSAVPAGAEIPVEEKEEILREAGEARKQFSPNLALADKDLAQQVQNEAQFGRVVQDIQTGKVPTAGGILPIRIQIPTTGQLYRFAKTIVSEEPLTMHFQYLSGGMLTLIKLLVVAVLLLLLFLIRGKLKQGWDKLRRQYRPHHTPFLLILLGLILWMFSRTLSIICFAGGIGLLLVFRFLRPPEAKT